MESFGSENCRPGIKPVLRQIIGWIVKLWSGLSRGRGLSAIGIGHPRNLCHCVEAIPDPIKRWVDKLKQITAAEFIMPQFGIGHASPWLDIVAVLNVHHQSVRYENAYRAPFPGPSHLQL
jgi:hypothetical protein